MLRFGRVEITGGFLLMAATLYYFDSQGFLLWAALACGLHELGHYAAIFFLGGRASRLRLSAVGAEMTLSAARPLGPLAQLLAALAGPVTNLALAMLCARLAGRMGEGWFVFAGLNLSLAAFNLLPVAQLDGGRAVYWLLVLLWSPHAAERAVRILSVVTAIALLLAGGALLWATGANFTLIVTALWLSTSLFLPQKRKIG